MPDTAAPDSRPTVLIFEDEALVALMVEDVLADADLRAVWVVGGRGEAPDAGPESASPLHAAVVDLRLSSDLDGRDVLRRLRERHPGMPAVVVTGYDPLSPEADLRGLGGPTVRLRKPFECAALLEHLAGVLDRPVGTPAPRRRASDIAAVAAA